MTMLRHRMRVDMHIRNRFEWALECTLKNGAKFALCCRRPLEDLGFEDIRKQQFDLVEEKRVSWSGAPSWRTKYRKLANDCYSFCRLRSAESSRPRDDRERPRH